MHVAYLYKRMGALQLFCALMVTTGLTLVDCYPGKTFSEFKQFLLKFFASNYCKDQKVLHLILNRTTQHSYTQAASCEMSSCEMSAARSASTAAVTSGV